MRCNKIKISFFLILLILFSSCNETENEVIIDRKMIDENTLEFNVDGVSFRMKHVLPGTSYIGLQTEDSLLPNYINQYKKYCMFCSKVTFTYDFWIAETEVTQELWEKVMGYNNSYFKGPKNPVENVNFYEIVTFFMKLNTMFNYDVTYTLTDSGLLASWDKIPETGSINRVNFRKGFRLPLDFEWEYAAHGGQNLDINEYLYSGKNIDDIAWYQKNSNNTTHAVGQKRPNKLGLYDMTGNVFEFTNNCYTFTEPDSVIAGGIFCFTNPLLFYKEYANQGGYSYNLGLCGGAYNSDTNQCFLAYRVSTFDEYMNFSDKASVYGFRILFLNSQK